MANIKDLRNYCTVHGLVLGLIVGCRPEHLVGEVNEGVVALGMLKNHRLPVIILKDDGQVEVLKAWAKSPNEDDVWAIVTDDELLLGQLGSRLHALK